MTEVTDRSRIPPGALPTGSVVASRYEILDFVGEGGMGTVYRARDRSLDEVLALKILRPQLVDTPLIGERFRAEIKLARRVTHPNVCRIHDYGEDGALAFISMELVEGVDLKRLIREQPALSFDEALDVALQLADGLQAVHEVGIIHRDFKTANVMIDRRGTVRLMDFGIAKLWESGSTDRLTIDGQITGTPEYMSPEQASGQALDPRSDVYALGVVLFELFTGIRPFAAPYVAAVIHKQLYEEAPWESPRAAALPVEVQSIIRRALAKNRDDRFRSVRDLRRTLEKVGADAVSAATEPAETLVLRVKAADTRLGTSIPLPADATRGAQATARSRRRTALPTWFVATVLFVAAGLGAAGLLWRNGSEKLPPGTALPSQSDNTDGRLPAPDRTEGTRGALKAPPIGRETVQRQSSSVVDTSVQARCDRGDADACLAFAEQLERGSGVSADPARAAEIYRIACDRGSARGCSQLGILYNRGVGVPRDLAMASVQYDRGCSRGDMAGCNNLGTLYQFGSAGFRGDRGKAAALYTRACDEGYQEGCTNLALLWLDDPASTPSIRSRALLLLKKACDAGVERACQRARSRL